jgi:hypothetical protein
MILTTILIMMAAIAPGADNVNDARAIAAEIARVAADRHEAAVMVVVAWRESAFRASAVGDGGLARCAFQLHGAPRSVLTDLRQCTELAAERLRASAAACPSAPLAAFASGTCERGRKISAWRMQEVAHVERAAQKASLKAADDLRLPEHVLADRSEPVGGDLVIR